MGALWQHILSLGQTLYTAIGGPQLARAVLWVAVGWMLARMLARSLQGLLSDRVTDPQVLLTRRVTFWGVWLLFIAAALKQLGFDLGVLLGAAGVLTVAVGFAAQTSASNIISGLFLLAERPFAIGDVIQVGQTSGEVLAVELMSVTLRTFDNRFVRLPNELLMRSEIVNETRFDIRRIDLLLRIDLNADLDAVRALLLDVVAKEHRCLVEPQARVFFVDVLDTAIVVKLATWASRAQFYAVKTDLSLAVARALRETGIGFAVPTRRWVGAPDGQGPAAGPGTTGPATDTAAGVGAADALAPGAPPVNVAGAPAPGADAGAQR